MCFLVVTRSQKPSSLIGKEQNSTQQSPWLTAFEVRRIWEVFFLYLLATFSLELSSSGWRKGHLQSKSFLRSSLPLCSCFLLPTKWHCGQIPTGLLGIWFFYMHVFLEAAPTCLSGSGSNDHRKMQWLNRTRNWTEGVSRLSCSIWF